jgi:hypothetical protein
VPVTAGASDGVLSEIISGDIEPGMKAIIDTLSSAQ